eukprot:Gb_34097 [translate_table: standard]
MEPANEDEDNVTDRIRDDLLPEYVIAFLNGILPDYEASVTQDCFKLTGNHIADPNTIKSGKIYFFMFENKSDGARTGGWRCCNSFNEMQLYHHPYSLDSQKVRLALEEKEVDYWPYSVNPLKAKNLDSEFFHMNPTGKIPVFMNGEHIIFDTLSIIQYIDSINEPLGRDAVDREKMLEWMRWIDSWNPKLFTLSHVPEKYRLFFSRFKRRAAIARMAENPDLASKYHSKLHSAYATEEQLKDQDAVNDNKEQLIEILDGAEKQLATTNYLAGAAFSMADAMFVPILARIELLNLGKEYIGPRSELSNYWNRVKKKPSYNAVIGKYFSGWRKYRTLYGTYSSVWIRNVLRRY